MFGTHVQKVNVTGPLLVDGEVVPPHAASDAESTIISPRTANFSIKLDIQREKERQGVIGALLSAHNSKNKNFITVYGNAQHTMVRVALECKLRFSRHTCYCDTHENLSISWIDLLCSCSSFHFIQ